MKQDDSQRIGTVLEHLNILNQHLDRGPLDDELVFDAVCLRMSAAIEELGYVDPALLERHFGDDWPKIRATRNAIAHGYAYVVKELIRSTVDENLPGFADTMNRMKSDLGGED